MKNGKQYRMMMHWTDYIRYFPEAVKAWWMERTMQR